MLASPRHVYTCDAFLGEGAFGKVFRARREDGEMVALKLVPVPTKAQLQTAQKEAGLHGIEHPNIVHCEDYFRTRISGRMYFVSALEYCAGGTLEDWLSGRLRLYVPWHGYWKWCCELLSAVACLHDRGIAHRDIKPENILITAEGDIKLGDLGIAVNANANATSGAEVATGYTGPHRGNTSTMLYWAPEMFDAGVDVFPAVDVFSLGLLLYTALTRSQVTYQGQTYVGTCLHGQYVGQAMQNGWSVDALFERDSWQAVEQKDVWRAVLHCMLAPVDRRITAREALNEVTEMRNRWLAAAIPMRHSQRMADSALGMRYSQPTVIPASIPASQTPTGCSLV